MVWFDQEIHILSYYTNVYSASQAEEENVIFFSIIIVQFAKKIVKKSYIFTKNWKNVKKMRKNVEFWKKICYTERKLFQKETQKKKERKNG